jgi:hypothetical protein
MRSGKFAILPLAALMCGGCGDLARQGRSPVQVVINSLEGASGASPTALGNPVLSDVETLVTAPAPCSTTSPCATFFNDVGEVTMSLLLKDPGQPGAPAAPSDLNQVTFTRYRVTYRRSDGRNTPGVDVPFPLDSAVTFTVPARAARSAPASSWCAISPSVRHRCSACAAAATFCRWWPTCRFSGAIRQATTSLRPAALP